MSQRPESAPPAGRVPPPRVREFHYRIGSPAPGHFPGHHRSKRGDSGFEFRGHASLLDAPDPRRLDLHASLRDPYGAWIVRVYSQRMSIPVSLIADLSGSMGFSGRAHKRDVLADFTEALAWSAWRTGDSFGFVGADEIVRPEWLQPQTRLRGAGALIAQRLRAHAPSGRDAAGLADAHRHLSRMRSLVFLVSDFHWPDALFDRVFDTLAGHEVVPVVVWDPLETQPPERNGLSPVVDAETGRRSLIWWRPLQRRRWAEQWAERRSTLQRVFRRRWLKPLFVEHGFDADAVTRHFHA